MNNYCQHGMITIGGRVVERPPAFGTTGLKEIQCLRAFRYNTEAAVMCRWSATRHLGQVKCQTS
jgi:hypothetical protein